MRIAVDIRALMEGKTTGIEVYLTNLLKNIFEIDKTNEYILFANSYTDIVRNLPVFNNPNVSMKITRYPNKFFNLAQKLGLLKMEKLLGRFDLFFSPHWRTTALHDSTPLVVTFHDLFFEIMPDFFTRRRRLWHRFMDYRKAAHRANKIIAVSENTKKDLMEMYGIEEGKIEVVHPGIAPSPQSSPVQGEEERQYFLYFGTFEPRKNIETVLAAYEQYHRQSRIKKSLVIAGSEGWKTRIKIPAGLNSEVAIKQNVSEEEKTRLYQDAFAFIFPSFYEGFGFPILEAAGFGVPVIASCNSSLAEIGKDFALFANPLRPAQFARSMLELENDEKLCRDLRDKGYAAAQKFSWGEAARKTLQVFAQAS